MKGLVVRRECVRDGRSRHEVEKERSPEKIRKVDFNGKRSLCIALGPSEPSSRAKLPCKILTFVIFVVSRSVA
jgi:hypothetical protein